MSKLLLSALLFAAVPCASALAQQTTAGALPDYCANVQKLGDGSWAVRTAGPIDGMSYSEGTVFAPGEMRGGMDVASQLTDDCVR